MALRQIHTVNRSEGALPKTGSVIIAGEVIMWFDASHVEPYADATGAAVPYGVAAESTSILPLASPSGLTAGQGYDYTNFARGGLVGAYINGSELELYDDGHGLPFDNTVTYALNAPVYTNASGKITSSAATTTAPVQVGSVTAFDVAGPGTTTLRVKFTL